MPFTSFGRFVDLLLMHSLLHSYVRNKGAKVLKDCVENLSQFAIEIQALTVSIERARGVIAEIDKEIHESGASMANLRENIRIRHLVRDIAATQEEIDSHDMEEAAKARRNFDQQYKVKKDEESNMQSKVHLCCTPPPRLVGLIIPFTVLSYWRRVELAQVAADDLGRRP